MRSQLNPVQTVLQEFHTDILGPILPLAQTGTERSTTIFANIRLTLFGIDFPPQRPHCKKRRCPSERPWTCWSQQVWPGSNVLVFIDLTLNVTVFTLDYTKSWQKKQDFSGSYPHVWQVGTYVERLLLTPESILVAVTVLPHPPHLILLSSLHMNPAHLLTPG